MTSKNLGNLGNSVGLEESTINEINPIKPVILDLPIETIYKGIVKNKINLICFVYLFICVVLCSY